MTAGHDGIYWMYVRFGGESLYMHRYKTVCPLLSMVHYVGWRSRLWTQLTQSREEKKQKRFSLWRGVKSAMRFVLLSPENLWFSWDRFPFSLSLSLLCVLGKAAASHPQRAASGKVFISSSFFITLHKVSSRCLLITQSCRKKIKKIKK